MNRLIISIGAIGWLILTIGFVYSFVVTEGTYATERSTMSDRTFVQVVAVFLGWLVCCVGAAMAVFKFAKGSRERLLIGGAALNFAYAIPMGIVLGLQEI